MSHASDNPLPPIIAIVGLSGSGKTTYLERLIPELKHRGYRVGTIKHHRHAVEIDYEGKDSWRHRQAGADAVVLASPERMAVIKTVTADMTIDQIRQQFLRDIDIILAEGYKGAAAIPKIEIFRAEAHDAPICLDDPMLRAMVSDDPCEAAVACFGLEDVKGLADFLERHQFFA